MIWFLLVNVGFFASILMTRIESWRLLMSMKFFPFCLNMNLLKYGADFFVNNKQDKTHVHV
jgi:hypothetical protein